MMAINVSLFVPPCTPVFCMNLIFFWITKTNSTKRIKPKNDLPATNKNNNH